MGGRTSDTKQSKYTIWDLSKLCDWADSSLVKPWYHRRTRATAGFCLAKLDTVSSFRIRKLPEYGKARCDDTRFVRRAMEHKLHTWQDGCWQQWKGGMQRFKS